MVNDQVKPLLISGADVGKMLSIGRSSVGWLVASGELRGIKIGRGLRIPIEDVYALIARNGAQRPVAKTQHNPKDSE